MDFIFVEFELQIYRSLFSGQKGNFYFNQFHQIPKHLQVLREYVKAIIAVEGRGEYSLENLKSHIKLKGSGFPGVSICNVVDIGKTIYIPDATLKHKKIYLGAYNHRESRRI